MTTLKTIFLALALSLVPSLAHADCERAEVSPRLLAAASAGVNAGAAAAAGEMLLFIDALEGTHARLLSGLDAFEVPARLLPPGAIEGTWLRLSLTPAPAPPDEAEALRAKLARDDDGGDIKL